MKIVNELFPELIPQYEFDNDEEMDYVKNKYISQIPQEEDKNDLPTEVEDFNALRFEIH